MNTTKPTTADLETIEQRADAYLAKLRARSAPKKPPVPLDVALAFLAVLAALIYSGPKAAAITAGACVVLIAIVLPILLALAAGDD